MSWAGGSSEPDVKERERDFHDRRFAHEAGARKQDRFYPALHQLREDFNVRLDQVARGSDVLELGCGTGTETLRLAATAAPRSITGIDISGVAVAQATEHAQQRGLPARFIAGDCEAMEVADGSFDVVFGSGILHHLDLSRIALELHRVTRPGATLLFQEPLATNPLIGLYRRLTPSARSADEHPLRGDDLQLLRRWFRRVEVRHYGLMTLAALPFHHAPDHSRVHAMAQAADRRLLRGPLRWLAWSVLIELER